MARAGTAGLVVLTALMSDPIIEVEGRAGAQIIRIRGALEADGLMQAILRRRSHPSYVPGIPSVWDFEQADLRWWNRERLLAFAASMEDDEEPVSMRIAFVASSPLNFGLLRQWEVVGKADPQQRSVFKTIDAALAWATTS